MRSGGKPEATGIATGENMLRVRVGERAGGLGESKGGEGRRISEAQCY
jgi:hypothetical protein